MMDCQLNAIWKNTLFTCFSFLRRYMRSGMKSKEKKKKTMWIAARSSSWMKTLSERREVLSGAHQQLTPSAVFGYLPLLEKNCWQQPQQQQLQLLLSFFLSSSSPIFQVILFLRTDCSFSGFKFPFSSFSSPRVLLCMSWKELERAVFERPCPVALGRACQVLNVMPSRFVVVLRVVVFFFYFFRLKKWLHWLTVCLFCFRRRATLETIRI